MPKLFRSLTLLDSAFASWRMAESEFKNFVRILLEAPNFSLARDFFEPLFFLKKENELIGLFEIVFKAGLSNGVKSIP